MYVSQPQVRLCNGVSDIRTSSSTNVPASEDKDTISTGRPSEDDLHCIGMGIFLRGKDVLVHVSGDAVAVEG